MKCAIQINLPCLALPKEKIDRIILVAATFVNSRCCRKRELLSLLGHLNFAMRIIPQGRPFISHLLVLASSARVLEDLISLSQGCRDELRLWTMFLKQWNGLSLFYNNLVSSVSVGPTHACQTAPSEHVDPPGLPHKSLLGTSSRQISNAYLGGNLSLAAVLHYIVFGGSLGSGHSRLGALPQDSTPTTYYHTRQIRITFIVLVDVSVEIVNCASSRSNPSSQTEPQCPLW